MKNTFSEKKILFRFLLITSYLIVLVLFFKILTSFAYFPLDNQIPNDYESLSYYIKLIYFILRVLKFILIFVYIVLFLIWIYKSHKNLDVLGVTQKNFSSKWTVIWFLIPFAFFIKPIYVVREIVLNSIPENPKDDMHYLNQDKFIIICWFFAVLSIIFMIISIILNNLEYTLKSNNFLVFSELSIILTIWFCTIIINSNNIAQLEKYHTLQCKK